MSRRFAWLAALGLVLAAAPAQTDVEALAAALVAAQAPAADDPDAIARDLLAAAARAARSPIAALPSDDINDRRRDNSPATGRSRSSRRCRRRR